MIFEYRQPVIWFAMGNIYSKLQDEKNQIEAYKQARRIYQKLRDNEGEIDFLIKVWESRKPGKNGGIFNAGCDNLPGKGRFSS